MIFRTRRAADPVSFASDSDSYLLTLDRSRSEQDSSVRVFAFSEAVSMQFCAIECFHESGCKARSRDCIRGRPFHRHQVTGARRLGRCTLPVAARKTDRSHLPDISLFRYFVLAHTQRASDDWAGASVTRVCGEVKVLFAHSASQRTDTYPTVAHPDGDFWSELLAW